MTDDDMFETMDRILGEKEVEDEQKLVMGDWELRSLRDVGSKPTDPLLRNSNATDSKPSHPLWKLIDQWGGSIYLSADQLELWGVDNEV